ncbi:hypothetical protein ACHBTE_00760 [Streptomyces sp. M41]|uniref:hypothetical protein n=1 Tax=Streptomyces sp. M41 TaxID=3059412 RepID=UPI00374DAE71
MAVEQLPARIREFVDHLGGLLARLDQGGGWCGVFWHRDPDGMRACLDGRELPPWDVVESLLDDLAARYGPGVAGPETERARALHAAALTESDARPGAREALGDRLDVMLREQRYAVERQTELSRSLAAATSREEAEAIRLDLAWAHDDHERATARCAELRSRMADLDRRATRAHGHVPDPAPTAPRTLDAHPHLAPAPAPHSNPGPAADPDRPATPKQRKRRRGGARFAGVVEEEAAPVVVPPAAAPTLPTQPATARRTPRGARFAGAADDDGTVGVPQERAEAEEALDVGARGEVARTVRTLVRLRREGRSGEAHALLVEAAYWPAPRFPALAVEMERAGLGADWATLLWEAASLPAERLVAAADALTVAGRADDAEQILRQGVARPADEVARAVVALTREGRGREVRALLAAYVGVRTPEEAARSAASDPRTLVPLLLEAARGISDERHWDLVHALRVAGFTP